MELNSGNQRRKRRVHREYIKLGVPDSLNCFKYLSVRRERRAQSKVRRRI